jgi:hypothetical protein
MDQRYEDLVHGIFGRIDIQVSNQQNALFHSERETMGRHHYLIERMLGRPRVEVVRWRQN